MTGTVAASGVDETGSGVHHGLGSTTVPPRADSAASQHSRYTPPPAVVTDPSAIAAAAAAANRWPPSSTQALDPLEMRHSSTTSSVANSAGAASLHGHELLVSLLIESHKKQVLSRRDRRNSSATSGAPGTRRDSLTDPLSRIDNVIGSIMSPLSPNGTKLVQPTLPVASVESAHDGLHWTMFKDPEYFNFLNHLASAGLEEIQSEPQRLSEQSKQIESKLAELAFTEHRSFLEANSCSQSIHRQLYHLHGNLGRLADATPPLAAASIDCQRACEPVLEERRKMATVLAHHERILEVLEIPQLMDTFIRNGNYEEAMDLQTHVSRMIARHPHIPVLQHISAQVHASTTLMLNQLLSILCGNAKLPLCIRIIGYLRRLDAFPEAELRIVFLQQKDAYFQTLLSAIVEKEPAEFLKKYIEVSREHFFDIVTQYKAIFSDTTSITPPATFAAATSGLGSSAPISGQSGSPLTATILSSYATHTVHSFLNHLATKTPQIHDATSLNSVLTQTMYYGMSLGRVGIDFRDAVVPLFVSAIERVVRDFIGAGVDNFLEWCGRIVDAPSSKQAASVNGIGGSAMSLGSNSGALGGLGGVRKRVAAIRVKSALAGSIVLSSDRPSAGTSGSNAPTTMVAAPAVLLTFPPLALLVNSFFAGFNQLRVCAPVALHRPIADFIVESLNVCVGGLYRVGEAIAAEAAGSADDGLAVGSGAGEVPSVEEDAEDAEGVAAFRDAVKVFVDIFVPAVLTAYDTHVYGGLAAVLGGSTGRAGGGSGGTASDSAASTSVAKRAGEICEPIAQFLPPPPAPPPPPEPSPGAGDGDFGDVATGAIPTGSGDAGDVRAFEVEDDADRIRPSVLDSFLGSKGDPRE
ncbi:Dor1-like family-domain-containing protein [Zopfochytrium polystomum]|nr:Dor1-like family-domain-containing protein [Zopfochytrium polystomum]